MALLEVERGWLPPTRGWAASPDVLYILARHVLATKPAQLVECGSGVSSLVIGRCLELIGAGQLHSLDHQADYAQQTRENLAERGLSDRVEVFTAPLKPYQIKNPRLKVQAFRWYDLANLPDRKIDCLVVDGPPLDTGPIARYPAGPLLFKRLVPGSTVFLDDFNRMSERHAFQAWVHEFPHLTSDSKPAEKGCGILHYPGN